LQLVFTGKLPTIAILLVIQGCFNTCYYILTYRIQWSFDAHV